MYIEFANHLQMVQFSPVRQNYRIWDPVSVLAVLMKMKSSAVPELRASALFSPSLSCYHSMTLRNRRDVVTFSEPPHKWPMGFQSFQQAHFNGILETGD